MNHKQKNQSGISYIEMAIIIAIIGILCAMLLTGFKSAEMEISLRNSAYQVAGDIRKAQNMAMATVEQSGGDPYGYGVRFVSSSDSYFIFADMNNDKVYNAGIDTIVDLNQINLPDDIEIFNVSPASQSDIVFVSPDPTTFINGNSSIGVSSTITLKIKGGGSFDCQNIIVETSGNIKVK